LVGVGGCGVGGCWWLWCWWVLVVVVLVVVVLVGGCGCGVGGCGVGGCWWLWCWWVVVVLVLMVVVREGGRLAKLSQSGAHSLTFVICLTKISKIACDRELVLFIAVDATWRRLFPCSIKCSIVANESTAIAVRPATKGPRVGLSRTASGLLFAPLACAGSSRRSNTCASTSRRGSGEVVVVCECCVCVCVCVCVCAVRRTG
jgi:hypothetical protein